MEHLKSLGIKARADFRKQLAAYERLKKSQVVFSPALTKLAGGESVGAKATKITPASS